MTILAKTNVNSTYLYKYATAHKVSKAASEIICTALNMHNWQLQPGEKWHVYNIDKYDTAYSYALDQSFTRRGGNIQERKTNIRG